MLPAMTIDALQNQLAQARLVHERDLAAGFGAVWLPDALARKYPHASREWAWQYVFPASTRSIDPRSGATMSSPRTGAILRCSPLTVMGC